MYIYRIAARNDALVFRASQFLYGCLRTVKLNTQDHRGRYKPLHFWPFLIPIYVMSFFFLQTTATTVAICCPSFFSPIVSFPDAWCRGDLLCCLLAGHHQKFGLCGLNQAGFGPGFSRFFDGWDGFCEVLRWECVKPDNQPPRWFVVVFVFATWVSYGPMASDKANLTGHPSRWCGNHQLVQEEWGPQAHWIPLTWFCSKRHKRFGPKWIILFLGGEHPSQRIPFPCS